jgi:hypothetical protein
MLDQNIGDLKLNHIVERYQNLQISRNDKGYYWLYGENFATLLECRRSIDVWLLEHAPIQKFINECWI